MIKKFKEFTNERIFLGKKIVPEVGFPKTKQEIDVVCKEFSIKNYEINKDMSIDVEQVIDFRNNDLYKIPLNFNKSYVFYCDDNRLSSLEGCPKHVDGPFGCSGNELTTLEGCPKYIGGDFYLHHNKLSTLKGCPGELLGDIASSVVFGKGHADFDCSYCNLYTLEGCPKKITGRISFEHNPVYDMLNEILFDGDADTVKRIFEAWDLYQPVYKDKTFLGKERWVILDYRLRELYIDVTDLEYEGKFPKFKNYTLDKT